ncbi:MAG: S8 family serine peptidase, partial [candidate division WOR-3 bacterium]
KATKEVIEELAKREEVEYIIEDFVIQIEEVRNSEELTPLTPPWNIIRVKADSCWMIGYTGEEIIIGHMDTGVDVNHPALAGKWLSPYWYDPINGQTNPYDDNGHGTHTMGIILGGDGLGPFQYDIGVAPGAKFVACKVCNSSGLCASSAIHSGFQQIATWKSQGVPIAAVSNSWGSSNTTSLEFWDDCMNWRNLGVFPVFLLQRTGSVPGTVGTPGNFPIVIGVGPASDTTQKGPAPNQPPWNDSQYWMRPDWNLTKPDICAPNLNIYSSLPGGSYGYMSGASLATPHVTGAIAIINQKNPILDVPTIYNLLLDYADKPPQGAPYPNNTYGWGMLNIYQALLNTPPVNIKEEKISTPLFLRIYPTITKGEIYLDYMIPKNSKAEINVLSPAGAKVKTISTSLEKNGNVKKVSLKELPEGIYIIKVNTPYNSTKDKVILVK